MRIRLLSFFTILLALIFITNACDTSTEKTKVKEPLPITTTVEVTGGIIEGVEQDGLLTYKGIPFAAPPSGDLRWKAPAPVVPWEGVKKTYAFCNACMQTPNAMGNTAPVSEDCLYLDVWTPAKKTNENIPVIFWVHGGGYSGGSTSTPMYDGTGFAKKGVVMVSVAYRLGPFGFLAHPELSSESNKGSGTYGIQDMIAGLKWVKKNITSFGGDPSNVTILGHSAGGAAISVLAASPSSKGLFQQAICMSGGSFGMLQTSKQSGIGLGVPSLKLSEQNGVDLLEQLGVADIKSARALSAKDIQDKLDAIEDKIRFRPVADGYIIPNDLYSLYELGNFNYTPVLLGHTSDEVGTFGGNDPIKPDEFKKQIQTEYGSYANTILEAYPHSTEVEATKSSRNLKNDSSFTWNTWAWSSLQAQKGKNKAFQYYFDYHPDSLDGGAGHGSDIPYAFQTLEGPVEELQQEDLKLSDMISTYWINFAKSGDPNGPGLPEWPSFNLGDHKVMIFNEASEARPLPDVDRLKVFDGYIQEQRGN